MKSISEIKKKKLHSDKITVVTAYDYSTAKICDTSGIDIILVGDSAGMVMLGYDSTISVTMDDMIVFCKGVLNGSKNALVVADMPFGSYQSKFSDAMDNSIKFMKLGCNAVKIEGGSEISPLIEHLSCKGIPIMGHIGLKPQTSPLWSGYNIYGKTCEESVRLLNDAIALEKAGAFSIVLEMVTSEIAEKISQTISIPTIGIGSGNKCDGQVLVLHDLLGLYDKIKPKFVKRYVDSISLFSTALETYIEEVKAGEFPSLSNSYSMIPEEFEKFDKYFKSLCFKKE